VIGILVIGAIAMLGTSPAPAQVSAFCLPCVIQAVLTTITVTIGGRLTQVNGVLAVISAALPADGVAVKQDPPGEVADSIYHRAVPRCAAVDHVDQPSHRHPTSPRRT